MYVFLYQKALFVDGFACLDVPQSVVDTLLREELFVCAAFFERAIFEDDDLIGVSNGGESVGDDHRRTIFSDVFEGTLDRGLCLVINGRGCFIEQEDGGIFEDGSGDGEALSLPT